MQAAKYLGVSPTFFDDEAGVDWLPWAMDFAQLEEKVYKAKNKNR